MHCFGVDIKNPISDRRVYFLALQLTVGSKHTFTYDYVLPPEACQEEVYTLVRELLLVHDFAISTFPHNHFQGFETDFWFPLQTGREAINPENI